MQNGRELNDSEGKKLRKNIIYVPSPIRSTTVHTNRRCIPRSESYIYRTYVRTYLIYWIIIYLWIATRSKFSREEKKHNKTNNQWLLLFSDWATFKLIVKRFSNNDMCVFQICSSYENQIQSYGDDQFFSSSFYCFARFE